MKKSISVFFKFHHAQLRLHDLDNREIQFLRALLKRRRGRPPRELRLRAGVRVQKEFQQPRPDPARSEGSGNYQLLYTMHYDGAISNGNSIIAVCIKG